MQTRGLGGGGHWWPRRVRVEPCPPSLPAPLHTSTHASMRSPMHHWTGHGGVVRKACFLLTLIQNLKSPPVYCRKTDTDSPGYGLGDLLGQLCVMLVWCGTCTWGGCCSTCALAQRACGGVCNACAHAQVPCLISSYGNADQLRTPRSADGALRYFHSGVLCAPMPLGCWSIDGPDRDENNWDSCVATQ